MIVYDRVGFWRALSGTVHGGGKLLDTRLNTAHTKTESATESEALTY
jgi:hypothetical protein